MSEVCCRMIGLDGVTRWIRGGGTPRRDGDRVIVEGIVRDATAEVERRGAAARGLAHRRADRHLQPPPLRRGARGRAGALARASNLRRACSSSTSTTSSRSTTPTATRSATRSWSSSRHGCATRCAATTRRPLGRRGVHRAGAGARGRARLRRICEAPARAPSRLAVRASATARSRHRLGRRRARRPGRARTS